MDMSGRTKADLAAIIGANRVSEILDRRRPLTLPMIRAISEHWELPTDLLVADYPINRTHNSGRTPSRRRGHEHARTA